MGLLGPLSCKGCASPSPSTAGKALPSSVHTSDAQIGNTEKVGSGGNGRSS